MNIWDTQAFYDRYERAFQCHCGKDGHALNSINCPVHGKRNNQMTRTEAYNKLSKLNYDTDEGIKYDLAVLEALGLIKFEEEKQLRTCVAFKVEDYPNGLDIVVGGNVIFKS